MTVSVEKARCPACGNSQVYTIHVRSDLHADLVCGGCWHGDATGDDIRRPPQVRPGKKERT